MSRQSLVLAACVAAAFSAGAFGVSRLGSEAPVPASKTLPQTRIDAASRTPVGMVVNWARTVMAGERDPKAVVWEQLLASHDGSVVCLAYRTRGETENQVRRVSFIVESVGAKRAAWDDTCSRGVVSVADAQKWIAVQ